MVKKSRVLLVYGYWHTHIIRTLLIKSTSGQGKLELCYICTLYCVFDACWWALREWADFHGLIFHLVLQSLNFFPHSVCPREISGTNQSKAVLSTDRSNAECSKALEGDRIRPPVLFYFPCNTVPLEDWIFSKRPAGRRGPTSSSRTKCFSRGPCGEPCVQELRQHSKPEGQERPVFKTRQLFKVTGIKALMFL